MTSKMMIVYYIKMECLLNDQKSNVIMNLFSNMTINQKMYIIKVQKKNSGSFNFRFILLNSMQFLNEFIDNFTYKNIIYSKNFIFRYVVGDKNY